MTKATAIKNQNGSGWLIDDGSGTSIRYPTKAAALATIANRERIEAKRVENEIADRATRVENVRAYLAARVIREASRPVQLSLFA